MNPVTYSRYEINTVHLLNAKEIMRSKKAGPDSAIPTGNFMFKVNNRNTRIRCEICSGLTIETLE